MSRLKHVLFKSEHKVPQNAINRIWGDAKYRVFISHLTKFKKEAEALREQLEVFGIASFVAHTSIRPTKKWQDEIEFALSSMDILVALMTKDFHKSKWTDQEIGFALGRQIPIISIGLGADPYGFIGKFQAVSGPLETVHNKILHLLINESKMQDCFSNRMQECGSFHHGNLLAKVLPGLETISPANATKMIKAFNNNSEISSAFGFNGTRPNEYGKGLAHYLSKVTGKKYRRSEKTWKIQEIR